MTNSHRCIFHRLWRDKCCCSVMEAMWLCLLLIVHVPEKEHGFWILWSDVKLLKWNPNKPNITFASYTYWIWTVIHVVTGSLKTPRGLCNIFFVWTLKQKLNQNKQIEGNPLLTLTFSIVLVAQDVPIWTIQSLRLQNLSKNDGVLRGVDENDEHKTHAKTAK